MKVIILAEQCNPLWASLPEFSFSLVHAISQHVTVVLVTHIRNKEGIEQKDNGFAEIVYVDNEYIASPLNKVSNFLRRIGIGGWMTNMALKYPAYIAFEKQAHKILKERIRNNEFDFIQRISPVSPTIPSPITSWEKIPFILGPLNGALAWPDQFKNEIKKERELLSHIRNVYKYLPYYKSTFHHSYKILAAFKHVEKDIPNQDKHKVIKFNELGVDENLYKPREEKDALAGSCRFIFVGRLVPYKCTHVVVLAFAKSRLLREKHRLTIVGDGVEREYIQRLIDDNNLNDCVTITGWKSQPEVAKLMANSDVFVFPTIREVGGNVIIEAMSSGLPSIVPDYGGPSELIDDEVGIKIPLTTRAEFQEKYTTTMEKLANDVDMRKHLSINARKRAVEEHSWSAKGLMMKQIYDASSIDQRK